MFVGGRLHPEPPHPAPSLKLNLVGLGECFAFLVKPRLSLGCHIVRKTDPAAKGSWEGERVKLKLLPCTVKEYLLSHLVAKPSASGQAISFIWPWVITYASILGWMSTHVPPVLMFTRATGVLTHSKVAVWIP